MGLKRRVYNLKKIVKVLLIITIYIFIFWGLYRLGKNIIDNIKKDNCTCEPTISEVIEVKPQINANPNELGDAKEEVKTTEKVKDKKQEKKKVVAVAKNNKTKDDYKNYAYDLVINQYLWSESDYDCLVKLWNRESGWNPNSHNKSSGAHGIPQSLPASKMSSEGDDYYTNGYTQIRWGLKYIKQRYGTPTKAWAHSQKTGWY